jgi:hypothetical protein
MMAKMDEMIDGEEVQDVERALALFSDTPEFDAEDTATNYLRLAQGLTAEVQDGSARPGQFVVQGFPAEEDLRVVPLQYAKMREYRNPGDHMEQLCFSGDGVTGVGDPGGECASCPLNQWTPNPDKPGRNSPPACKLNYGYVFYSEQHDAAVSFRFKGRGIKAGRLLNTIVKQNGMGKVVIKLTSEQQSVGGNTFYVPKVAMVLDAPEVLEAVKSLLG